MTDRQTISRAPLSATRGAVPAAPDVLQDDLADPLALPAVPLPSRFRPEAFKQASQARGARPASLRDIDALLAKVDGTPDPQARFAALTELQAAVDQFVRGYDRDNARGKAAWDLKQWVDGAVALRAGRFAR
ncbi:MAG TPA: hypothetical protein PKA64_01415 [Myxococcota bacterium]|nr:hypothetical protein [Myxococcota bacterium]